MTCPPSRRRLLAVALLLPLATRAADLPALVARSRASVLPVGTYNATDNPRFGFRGTGYVVGDGSLLATCAHVLPPPDDVAALERLAVLVVRGEGQGEVRRARVAAQDRTHDTALLKIEGAPLAPLPLAEPDAVREGQSIALIGFPIGGVLGYSPVTHTGIVASITTAALPAPTSRQLDERTVARLREGNFQLLQLDATAYPGNSGGPLLDVDSGQVVGTLNMGLVKGTRESAFTSPTGISYAIPVRYLRALMADAAANPQAPQAPQTPQTPQTR